MQIKPITNSEEWMNVIRRGARAKRMDEKQLAGYFVMLLLRTQYMHNWLYYLPIRGRKNKGNQDKVIDSIGDIQVVLIILCMQLGLGYQMSLEEAYKQIKGRTGKMVNGVFVKTEDLEAD